MLYIDFYFPIHLKSLLMHMCKNKFLGTALISHFMYYNNYYTVKPRYNAVAGRHLLGQRYSEARYRFCRQFFFFFLIFYIFFTTHFVYCIFIRICFIALSKRNQNRCPKQDTRKAYKKLKVG